MTTQIQERVHGDPWGPLGFSDDRTDILVLLVKVISYVP